MQVDQLVAELLATGTMNEDTTLDLNRMLDDWRAGRLDPDDQSYLIALHARIMHQPMPDSEELPALAAQALDGLTIEQWRDRALAAEARIAELTPSDGD